MTYRFVPSASFIAVEVEVIGAFTVGKSLFALDTGATRTVIDARLMSQIGFDPSNAIKQATANIVGGKTTMDIYRIPRLTALGIDAIDFDVCGFPLNSKRFDGLLGKDFFRARTLTIDFRNGTIDLT